MTSISCITLVMAVGYSSALMNDWEEVGCCNIQNEMKLLIKNYYPQPFG